MKVLKANRESQAERGGIFILTALFLTILFAFAALAIDLSLISSAHSKQERLAGFAALGALETFLTTNDFTQARERAAGIVGLGENRFVIHDYLENNPDSSWDLLGPSGGGTIDGGRWCFIDIDGVCDCPGGVAPCFNSLPPGDPATNAFRIQLQLPTGSFFGPIFDFAFGDNQSLNMQSVATASLVPRQGTFLVDLSGSTDDETHRASVIAPPWGEAGDEFSPATNSYALAAGSCPADDVLFTDCRDAPPVAGGSCPFTGPNAGQFGSLWYFTGQPPHIGSVNPNSRYFRNGNVSEAGIHFRDDYLCQIVPDPDGELAAKGVSTDYFVDVAYPRDTPGGGRYHGPEPLTTILDGIDYALQEFQNRSVAGDQAGIIGFDRLRYEMRTFGLRRPPSATEGPGDPAFDAWQELRNVATTPRNVNFPPDADPAAQRQFIEDWRMDTFFFTGTAAETNLPGVLSDALDAFINAPGFGVSEAFVILFSDGKTNCTSNIVNSCGTTTGAFLSSFSAANSVIADYVAQRVVFHVVLVGEGSGPHTLVINRGGGNGCYSDGDARLAGLPFIEDAGSGTYLGGPGQPPFFLANNLWGLAKQTQGLFVPIRPPCLVAGSCIAANYLDSSVCVDAQGIVATGDPNGNLSASQLDSEGRLRCDPLCRTNLDQVQTAIADIMGRNPYVLVE